MSAESLPRLIPGRAEFKAPGSALARGLLRLAGWTLRYDGLSGGQGVIMVYPHTSNWDFILGILVKWAFGIQARWWGKDSLFKVPLLGPWCRRIGGIPVDRANASGLVGNTADQMKAARTRGELFWLAVAPEGTRSLTTGWRSGSYHVAVQAGAPVGLAYFDFATRTVGLTHFVELSGEPERDFALFAQLLAPYKGKRPELAGPVKLRT
ncbi:1-acyl-sn-glycerol-3-phosphate acyltransferase [Pelomonas sp. SE-A7]|uniref:1-acyl-sn-glycerol-3-phosphate acyltransferase n=1 Tax=Pelomonas sp. SE-A7 TaxID=3054953 RepID=UPI00259C7742|nr:1-acyl-sn-glycerol-3-phosphate acyltransferase [Pelomonas sp. SE-A7]MDM4765893.1 1-acyl-sn-glycerol-3-phosphate acyltransferase [Pelomonas sp. SE-A7]